MAEGRTMVVQNYRGIPSGKAGDAMALWSDDLVGARNAVIRHLVDKESMPSVSELAADLAKSTEAVSDLLRQLHEVHALLLDEQGNIRMLNPFWGIPTAFRVVTNSRTYWANCAWDALGIPAALHSDAVIHAAFAHPEEEVTIHVQDGTVHPGHYLVQFPHPRRQWYDDLVFT